MSSLSKIICVRAFLLLGIIVLVGQLCPAQSGYFNVPNADVISERQLSLEADFDAKMAKFDKGGWQGFGLASIFGVRKKTEIGLNAYFVRNQNGVEPLELQPHAKFQIHNNESTGTSFAVGGVGFFSLKRAFADSGQAFVYAVGSKKFKKAWTPKLTGGVYEVLGAKADGDSRRGVMLAFEQPIHRRVSLIADWNTGRNRFGYSSAGFALSLTKRSFLSSAYYFGNHGRGNNFAGVYYTFSL